MFRRVRALAMIGALSLFTGCSSQTNTIAVPSRNTFPQLAHRERFGSGSVQWGIGFSADPSEYAGGGYGWNEAFCQDRKKNPCPDYHYGKPSGSYSVTHALNDPSYATVSDSESGTSKLGYASFSQSETVTGYYQHDDLAYAYNQGGFQWTDVITPTSSTLPYGSQVTFKITLTVSPSSVQAPCEIEYSTPTLTYGTVGTDKNGSQMLVEGSCEGMTPPAYPGTFVFRTGSSTGPEGTEDTGTFAGRIGQPLQINGGGAVSTGVCGNPNYDSCFGTYTDELSGTIKVKIKPKGSNFSFTTASGYMY